MAPLAITSPRAINANPIVVEARAACGNSFSADTISVSKSIHAMLIVPCRNWNTEKSPAASEAIKAVMHSRILSAPILPSRQC